MKRRMTQGLSVVLSTAMVLSGSGIGALPASASVKKDGSIESNISPAKTAEKQENKDSSEKETLDKPKKDSPDVSENTDCDQSEKNKQDEQERESEDAKNQADAESEKADEENSVDMADDTANENSSIDMADDAANENNSIDMADDAADKNSSVDTADNETDERKEEIKQTDTDNNEGITGECEKDNMAKDPSAENKEEDSSAKDNTDKEITEITAGEKETTEEKGITEEKETAEERETTEKKETTEENLQEVVSDNKQTEKTLVSPRAAEKSSEVTIDDLKNYLTSTDTTLTSISLTNDLELTDAITAANKEKIIIIPEGSTLTVSAALTSSQFIKFQGNGNLVLKPASDADGNPADTLTGKFFIGEKSTALCLTLEENSSINARLRLAIGKNASLAMKAGSEIKGGEIVIQSPAENITVEADAKVTFTNGAKLTCVPTNLFNDQGFPLTSTSQITIADENTVPASNQLTAGTYLWKDNSFCKEKIVEEEITIDDLKNFLTDTDTALPPIELTNDLELTDALTAANIDKTIIIPEGKTLTVSAALTSSQFIKFQGNGNLVLKPASDADGNPADTLTGKFFIGEKSTALCLTLEENSSINARLRLAIGKNASLAMKAESEIKGGEIVIQSPAENITVEADAKVTFANGAKLTSAPTNLFNDQGFPLTSTETTTIADENTAPASSQLTAGTYRWNGTCFYKDKPETPSGITTADELVKALEDDTTKTIHISGNILLNAAVMMSVEKTVTIDDGAELTIAGKITTNGKNLSFGGNGSVILKECFDAENKHLDTLQGSILIGTGVNDHITFTMTGNSSIRSGGKVTIGAGASFHMAAASQIISSKGGQTYTIDSASSLAIESGARFTIIENDKITAANKFSDQGKAFAIETQVIAGSASAPAADNQLTAGTYTWNGTCFFKPASSEPIPGSGITNEADLIAALQSDVTNILVTESFKLQANVTLTSNHILEVAEGKTLTITGQLATGKARLTFVGKGKVLVRLKGNLNGRLYIGLENQKEPKGGYVVLSDEGRISSGNPFLANGGKLEINAPEGISLSKGNIFTIEPGGTLTGTGGIRLAEGAKVTGAAGKFSDQGSSFSVNDEVVVAAANTVPADNQLSAGTYTWNGTCFFKPVPAPLPSTALKDGILILSNESVNHGSDEGWAWDAEKNVLNVNYRFKNIKQIQFAKSENASIKLNSDITLTPDEGMPAIFAGGNLLFRADDPYTLTVTGTVRAEGKIELINKITLNQSGTSEDALLWTEGDIMIKGNSKVIVNNQGTGAAIAGNAVTVKEEAELNVTGKGREPALKANGILGIGGPSAVVTAINRGKGPAISKHPNISDYPDAKISASESASGRPGVDYSAADVQKYRYIKVNKTIALSGNTTAAQVEKAVESLTADDYDAIDTVIEHIHALSETEKAALKPETLQKLDSLLQKATGIRPKLTLSDEADTPHNQQIMKAEIFGALIAAGLNTNDSHSNTSLAFIVRQLETAPDAAATFTCSLVVNGNEIGLKLPVTLKIELPPEYFPLGADQMFLRGIRRPVMKLRSLDTASAENVVERWLDFVYDGKDNSATFQTDLLGTFSLVRKAGIGKPGSGASSGSGGGSSSSGISRSNSPGTQNGGPGAAGGNWILDSVGWWYQYADQTYPSNGWFSLDYLGNKDWYYFNQNGYMLTGWVLSDGKWYYLNPVSDGSLGRMLTGWQQINGHWYYLNENSDGTRGAMLTDTWIEGNYVNPEGIWEEGKKK